MSKTITKIRCLYPDCLSPWRTRGLCPKHYAQLQKAVRVGETTWKKLEKKGWAKSSDKHYRKQWGRKFQPLIRRKQSQ